MEMNEREEELVVKVEELEDAGQPTFNWTDREPKIEEVENEPEIEEIENENNDFGKTPQVQKIQTVQHGQTVVVNGQVYSVVVLPTNQQPPNQAIPVSYPAQNLLEVAQKIAQKSKFQGF